MNEHNRPSGPERGSFGWALAAIATSLAEGAPTRATPTSELEGAAGLIVIAFREAGKDQVLLPSGVWDLNALSEGEELVFAREIVAGLFERMRLKIIWDPTATVKEQDGSEP